MLSHHLFHTCVTAAVAADDAVEDAAGALLNALSNIDTTNRSARIAAETCLLSAANAQKQSLLSLIKVEKESLLEQLRAIEELEKKLEKINVLADLDSYIELDKQYPGGRTEGCEDDDDDGGIASALAVLNCHSQGNGGVGLAGQIGYSVLEGWGSEDEEGILGRDEIEDFIQQLFNPEFSRAKVPGEGEKDKVSEQLEQTVSLLVDAVKDPTVKARTHRAYVCYVLNVQRSVETEIKGKVQFEGLCRILDALLSGCTRSSGDIANAKMCMMLSQTFFMVQNGSDETLNTVRTNQTPDRKMRTFVNSRLIGHSLWDDDDFWYAAISVSEKCFIARHTLTI